MKTFSLETKRLMMRPHEFRDVDFMVELNSDPDVTKYLGGEKTTVARAKEIIGSLQNQFKEKKLGRFIVIEKQTAEPIGWCGLKWIEERRLVDLGYRFQKKSWGKGFATEAGMECLRYGFSEIGLKEIYAG